MPRETGAPNRLNTLFNALLSGRGADPADILDRICRLLTPERAVSGLRQLSRLLREAGSLTTDKALYAACVMRMGGMPAHRIVQFLSLSLPGAISLSQFELAVRFMFGSATPLPDNLLYDLTQYTYLEQSLLIQRSVEVSERLSGTVTADMLLYLYLLSLREDLSNENVHLILLILRICFPALKIPRTSRGISAEEEGEIAEAWKNAERSARYVEALGDPTPRAKRGDKAARESASFFLDRYFADGAPQRLTAATAEVSSRVSQRVSGTRVAPPGDAARKPAEGAGARPHGTPRKRVAPDIDSGSAPVPMDTRVARKRRRKPAAAPAENARRPVTYNAPRRALLAVPFVLAAAVLLALAVSNFRMPESKVLRAEGASPATGSPQLAGPPQAAQEKDQPVPRSPSHVVQSGDSLWKIYRSLESVGAMDTGWKDFLLRVTERNALRNPDAIYPGNVLTLTMEKK